MITKRGENRATVQQEDRRWEYTSAKNPREGVGRAVMIN